jgi:hypothetical protein
MPVAQQEMQGPRGGWQALMQSTTDLQVGLSAHAASDAQQFSSTQA